MSFQCLVHTHFEYPFKTRFPKCPSPITFTLTCFQFVLLASSCVHSHPSFLVQTIISYASPCRLCLLGGEIDKINQILLFREKLVLMTNMSLLLACQCLSKGKLLLSSDCWFLITPSLFCYGLCSAVGRHVNEVKTGISGNARYEILNNLIKSRVFPG